MRHRLQLPAGPLRRFRLPPNTSRGVRPKRDPKKRTWALVPFVLFALLTYWLSAGRPLPDVQHWFEGPPRADRVGGGARSEAPQLQAAAPEPAPPAIAHPVPDATATAVPAGRETALDKPQTRKPPLVLERHRLRPVLGWEEPASGDGAAAPARSVRR